MMLKTLLIDDERPALHALEHLLKRYQEIEVIGAFTDPEQAKKAIQNNIDLVFLDIDMPTQTGIELAKKLLTQHPHISIIFVTAYSHFAVEAFEVNALDYIMKPVSPKRLDKTMARILENHQIVTRLGQMEKQGKFFNALIEQQVTEALDISRQSQELNLDETQPFSLFVLLLLNENKELPTKLPAKVQTSITTLMTELANDPNLIIWETPCGIGIADFSAVAGDIKEEEIEKASNWQQDFAAHLPSLIVTIGIGERSNIQQNFAQRYIQTRNIAGLCPYLAPEAGVYHFLDSSLLSILDQSLDPTSQQQLIQHTIGKVLEYDAKNNTDLFHTMEELILHNSLQEVAQRLFVHYKTVQFRKQSIEKILGISLHAFAGRTMVSIALILYYLNNLFHQDS